MPKQLSGLLDRNVLTILAIGLIVAFILISFIAAITGHYDSASVRAFIDDIKYLAAAARRRRRRRARPHRRRQRIGDGATEAALVSAAPAPTAAPPRPPRPRPRRAARAAQPDRPDVP
jgi:hypothetical protein